MDKWIERSIEIANSPGYLDKLHEIYPVVQETTRKVSLEIKRELEEIFKSEDNTILIKKLLGLPKFPIKDPYVAFLRKRDVFIQYNPKTVNRIAERVRAMGFNAMIASLEEPKEFNRQIGTLFGKWIRKIGHQMLDWDELKIHFGGIAFLRGGDALLKDFANKELGCDLDKGPDFIAKAKGTYIVGEAKFLTDYGGHQNAQFEDALRLLKNSAGRAIRIAVLDGVVWIQNGSKMFRTICALKVTALTALLLMEFLENF